jgi:hypothetical protein
MPYLTCFSSKYKGERKKENKKKSFSFFYLLSSSLSSSNPRFKKIKGGDQEETPNRGGRGVGLLGCYSFEVVWSSRAAGFGFR